LVPSIHALQKSYKNPHTTATSQCSIQGTAGEICNFQSSNLTQAPIQNIIEVSHSSVFVPSSPALQSSSRGSSSPMKNFLECNLVNLDRNLGTVFDISSSRSEPQKILMSPSIIQRDDNEICSFQSSTPIHKSSKGIVRGSLVPSTSAFHSSRSEPQKIIMSPSIIQRDDNEICNFQSSTPIHKSSKGLQFPVINSYS
jgi:hypothetical protein